MKSTAPGWTSNTSSYISRLSKSTQKIGPNQLLKVMAGDLVSGNVKYYYPAAVTNPAGSTIVNDVVTILGTIIGASNAVSLTTKAAAGSIATNAGSNAAFTTLLTSDAASPRVPNPRHI